MLNSCPLQLPSLTGPMVFGNFHRWSIFPVKSTSITGTFTSHSGLHPPPNGPMDIFLLKSKLQKSPSYLLCCWILPSTHRPPQWQKHFPNPRQNSFCGGSHPMTSLPFLTGLPCCWPNPLLFSPSHGMNLTFVPFHFEVLATGSHPLPTPSIHSVL